MKKGLKRMEKKEEWQDRWGPPIFSLPSKQHFFLKSELGTWKENGAKPLIVTTGIMLPRKRNKGQWTQVVRNPLLQEESGSMIARTQNQRKSRESKNVFVNKTKWI